MGSTQKLCGTCCYWVGPREPNFYGSAVMLDNQSVKGKCFCFGGPHMRADRLSNFTTCSRYEKWKVLR
jgi:hypothetical protein